MAGSRNKRSNDEVFVSKKDLWLSLLVWIPLVISLPLPFLDLIIPSVEGPNPDERLVAVIVFLVLVVPSMGLVAWLWFGTYYVLTDSLLLIHSGPFRWKMALDDITRVSPSRSVLSSPALSMDRLLIRYGKKSVLISPLDKQRFLKSLAKACPQASIEIRAR